MKDHQTFTSLQLNSGIFHCGGLLKSWAFEHSWWTETIRGIVFKLTQLFIWKHRCQHCAHPSHELTANPLQQLQHWRSKGFANIHKLINGRGILGYEGFCSYSQKDNKELELDCKWVNGNTSIFSTHKFLEMYALYSCAFTWFLKMTIFKQVWNECHMV